VRTRVANKLISLPTREDSQASKRSAPQRSSAGSTTMTAPLNTRVQANIDGECWTFRVPTLTSSLVQMIRTRTSLLSECGGWGEGVDGVGEGLGELLVVGGVGLSVGEEGGVDLVGGGVGVVADGLVEVDVVVGAELVEVVADVVVDGGS
jgi:hypothetical protein